MPDIKQTIEELKRLYKKTSAKPWSGVELTGDYPIAEDVKFAMEVAAAFPSLIAEIERLEKENERLVKWHEGNQILAKSYHKMSEREQAWRAFKQKCEEFALGQKACHNCSICKNHTTLPTLKD